MNRAEALALLELHARLWQLINAPPDEPVNPEPEVPYQADHPDESGYQ